MITLFCLLAFGQLPHQVGFPVWIYFVSLFFDIMLMTTSHSSEKKKDDYYRDWK